MSVKMVGLFLHVVLMKWWVYSTRSVSGDGGFILHVVTVEMVGLFYT